ARGNRHEVWISIVSISIRQAELQDFRQRMNIVARVMTHRLQVITFEYVEFFDKRWTLRKKSRFVNFIAAIFCLDGSSNLRMKFRKVTRGQQPTVCLHVIADAFGERSLIEIVPGCD